MTTLQTTKPWDFSQVLDLINTLSPTNSQSKDVPARPPIISHVSNNESSSLPLASPMQQYNVAQEGVSLGDFGKIWEYLGTPLNSPAPKPPVNTSPTLQQRMPDKTDYASDGAAYATPSKRITKGGIKWRDEVNAGDLTDFAPLDDEDDDDKKLTKKQRQKKNKKERERMAAEAVKSVSDADEPEIVDPRCFFDTPARKASTHIVSAELVGKAHRPASTVKTTSQQPATTPHPVLKDTTNSAKPPQSEKKPSPPPAPKAAPPAAPPKTPDAKHQQEFKKRYPISTPFANKTSSLFPASVQPVRTTSTPQKSTNQNANPFHKVQVVSETPTKNNRHAIQPKTVRSGEDRNLALLLKIIGEFYEDRASLVSPANSITHSNDPNGIHVFVDASNIFIGFHDQLKRARDIPQHVYVPRVDLSFDALALLMERRRPVAKRCLVGSKPHMAAFDVAKRVGYECNILDKVLKARELTERQIYFQEQEKKRRRSNSYKNGNSTGDSGGSGSETSNTGPVFAPEKYVEQGVDEILHLKMMESIVDTEQPATIVLATGDAAQAEYSQGFLKMAERALKKGWKVELVSWSKNISQLYKKAAWQKQWGGRFRIIELDTYAEELLDM